MKTTLPGPRVLRVGVSACLLLTGLTGAGLLLRSRPEGARRIRMDLEVALHLDRTHLLVGESTPIELRFTNRSARAIQMPDPERSYDQPRILVQGPHKTLANGYSPNDLANLGSQEFYTPRPPTLLTLEPQKQAQRAGDLLSWVPLPTPGTYELKAAIDWEGKHSASDPVSVIVDPLHLLFSDFVGSDSGYSPFRYCGCSCGWGQGSTVLLTCVSFNVKGKPVLTFSQRVADRNRSVRPIVSVTPNKKPDPAHWLLWLENGSLVAACLEDDRVVSPPKEHPLHLPGAELVGPAVMDPARAASGLSRVSALLWQPDAGHPRLTVATLDPGGALAHDHGVALAAGEIRWARTAVLSNGDRRAALLVQRGRHIELDLVSWSDGGAVHLRTSALAEGRLLGAGMSLNNDDLLHGAAVILPDNGGGLHAARLLSWHFGTDKIAHVSPPAELPHEGLPEWKKALVEVSPVGQTLLLLHGADGRWYNQMSGNIISPLPHDLAAFGEPVGAYWADPNTRWIVLANAQTGITYHKLGS